MALHACTLKSVEVGDGLVQAAFDDRGADRPERAHRLWADAVSGRHGSLRAMARLFELVDDLKSLSFSEPSSSTLLASHRLR